MKIWPIEITVEEVVALARIVSEGWRRLFVPKNSKGKIGIVVALQTENNTEKQRLERDLIRELDRDFQHSNLSGLFKIIKYPPPLAAKIDSPQSAEIYVRRSRAHFIVYGDLVQRQIEGKPNYVFRHHELVVHRPIPQEVSNQIATEFGGFLPPRLNFPVSDELIGFEFTKHSLRAVSEFMTGTAFLISGALDIAYKIMVTLESDLLAMGDAADNPIQEKLLHNVDLRIVDTLHAKMIAHYDAYVKSRNERSILDSQSTVDRLLERRPEDYRGTIQLAMILFFRNRIRDAIDLLKTVRSKDSAWRYSLGFLHAFDGNITSALEQYKKAYYGDFEPSTAVDIDEFIGDVLDKHPDRIQLHFFRGLINLKRKADYELAKKDFERFLNSKGASQFQPLVKLARKYLFDIKIHLGL